MAELAYYIQPILQGTFILCFMLNKLEEKGGF